VSGGRFLLDTAYVLALLDRRDQLHSRALAFLPRVRAAGEVWITEAVLVEIGNALGTYNRAAAAQFAQQCYDTPNIRVVSVDTALLQRALDLYRARPDKEWGLTDCISFVVMQDERLTDAITSDSHFQQAGYRALLAEQR
jgi:predicted nucleic acid-binding protein